MGIEIKTDKLERKYKLINVVSAYIANSTLGGWAQNRDAHIYLEQDDNGYYLLLTFDDEERREEITDVDLEKNVFTYKGKPVEFEFII